jgi:putative hydrolase of the HAD superfamily
MVNCGVMLKAITFDLWKTLVIYSDPEQKARRKRLRAEGMLNRLISFGYSVSLGEVTNAYECSGEGIEEFRKNLRELDTKTQLVYFLKCLGIDKHNKELLSALEKPYAEASLIEMPLLVESVKETINAIKNMKYKIGLISNVGRTPGRVVRVYLRNYNLLDEFDAVSFSDEIGFRKPHEKTFLETLSKLRVSANEAMHVGDDLYADIYGAKKVGMKTCLLGLGTRIYCNVEPDFVISELKKLKKILSSK